MLDEELVDGVHARGEVLNPLSELLEEQVFKAENDCDEVACEPKWKTE